MLRTRFTDLVGCKVPLQQAPMGSFSRGRLAGAVSAAGGLGMVVVTGEQPSRVAQRLDEATAQSRGPIGANFFLVLCDPATLPVCIATAAARVRVVDFFYGQPDPTLVGIVHQHGALASWQVGSLERPRSIHGRATPSWRTHSRWDTRAHRIAFCASRRRRWLPLRATL